MAGTTRHELIGNGIAAGLDPDAASQLVRQRLDRLLAGNRALAEAGLAENDDWLAV